MAIPNLVTLIKPLCERFPAAWKKARQPHDDGEFNARVCAVLHYQMGLTNVGRNGKRGDPNNLSKDVINWKGEGDNPDPVNGGFGTIIDFIGSHEAAGAHIVQYYTDPDGPGAWVKPLTLAEIDTGGAPSTPVVLPPEFPPRDLTARFFKELDTRYKNGRRPDRMEGRGEPLHVDNEGLYVWIPEFLRHYAVDHPTKSPIERYDAAVGAVMRDIDAAWPR